MKKNKFSTILSMALGLVMLGSLVVSALAAEGVSKIDKEKLKEMLDSPEVIILDVRESQQWQESEFKIKGAVRKMPKFFDSWATEFPKDKTLVLY